MARWQELTQAILPGMAADQRWPIRLDHCFMRVFLDNAIGGRWDLSIGRPAIRTISDAALADAVALAESVLSEPGRLPGLNDRSLAWRRAQRRPGAGLAAAGTRGGR